MEYYRINSDQLQSAVDVLVKLRERLRATVRDQFALGIKWSPDKVTLDEVNAALGHLADVRDCAD